MGDTFSKKLRDEEIQRTPREANVQLTFKYGVIFSKPKICIERRVYQAERGAYARIPEGNIRTELMND